MCEACRKRWGDELYDGVEEFAEEWPDAEFGPAHIVLSDFNLEPNHIRWCLGLIIGEQQRRGISVEAQHSEEATGVRELQSGELGKNPAFYADCDAEELQATADFLRMWLLPRVEARIEESPHAE